MNTSMLVRSFAILAIAALPAFGAPKKPIERPYHISGHVTGVLNLTNGVMTATDWGESSHCGRFSNEGTGVLTGGDLTATGTFTAANGDETFWIMDAPAVGETIVTITGGTGRFEGITGGFVLTAGPQTMTPGPGVGFVTISYEYEGVGTLKY